MILVGIDVAKDKHDCFIQTADGKVLFKAFSFDNNSHLVSRYSKTFAAYLKKKRDEGKHYFVALSHVAKKLVRVIFHLQRTGESFLDFA